MTKKLAMALVIALVIGAIFLLATGRTDILRVGVAAAACLLLPGLGWARRSQLPDIGDKLALAIGISICAVTFVGTAMAVARIRSPWLGAAALFAVAAAGWLPSGMLKAIPAGLKWLINLFAGPESPRAAGTSG